MKMTNCSLKYTAPKEPIKLSVPVFVKGPVDPTVSALVLLTLRVWSLSETCILDATLIVLVQTFWTKS